MPLPPALLARLRKRGIVQSDTQEEIIAESYDTETPSYTAAKPTPVIKSSSTLSTPLAGYAPGCPNKNNPYHQCLEFCHIHWGDGVVPEPRRDPTYERRRQRMLRRYPLPSADWREVYDSGVGRYYYWNMETDEVSWLSPTHPRAKIGVAAVKMAKAEWDRLKIQEDAKKRQKQQQQQRRLQEGASGQSRHRRARRSPSESGDESEHSEPESDQEEEESEDRGRRKKPEKRKLPNDLDPMDPAAYSEIPRGGWSAGLETKGDAKTGVDTTASGPLYQQRPYPAPGAVLRQNKEPPKKKPTQAKGPAIGPMDPRGRGGQDYDSDG